MNAKLKNGRRFLRSMREIYGTIEQFGIEPDAFMIRAFYGPDGRVQLIAGHDHRASSTYLFNYRHGTVAYTPQPTERWENHPTVVKRGLTKEGAIEEARRILGMNLSGALDTDVQVILTPAPRSGSAPGSRAP